MKNKTEKNAPIEPRNEIITIMLSASEKKDFIEKCEVQELKRSEQGRNLLLNWIYSTALAGPKAMELLYLKEQVKDLSSLTAMFTHKFAFYRLQLIRLRAHCSKLNIPLPIGTNSKYDSEKQKAFERLSKKIEGKS